MRRQFHAEAHKEGTGSVVTIFNYIHQSIIVQS